MKNCCKKIIVGLTLSALSIGMLSLNWGCRPLPTDNNTWRGDEQVYVTFGSKTATVSLTGMPISTYDGVDGVKLSTIVKKANLATTAELEDYYFNFIAVDAYDMSKMAIYWGKGLPTWDDMQRGHFYDTGSSSGLSIMWEEGTKEENFGVGRFYYVRLMDGGTIEILQEDVL